MYNNNISDVTITLSSLYELLLNIGNSFDIQENAELFLKTFMSQKNLSFAAYLTLEHPNNLNKVHSIPKIENDLFSIPPSSLDKIQFHHFYLLDAAHPRFQLFNKLTKQSQNEVLVYFTGSKSVLILAKKKGNFDKQDWIKYELVINKFSLFMESLESHHQIKEEIRIKEEQAEIIRINNEQLKKQNDNLVKYIRSNNELEQFAYRVSHDLNAPLRGVIEFSKLLERSAQENFSEKQNSLLKFILDSGIQMKGMIDGILDYSKITGAQLKLKKINLNQLIENVRNLLYHDLQESKGKIIVNNLPEFIVGDSTKMIQLFLNLISNALKFRKENLVPEIVINAKREEHQITFSISDNGIGIPQNSQGCIFELFSKAQNNLGLEGHGIGLNTCRQIIEQHKGEIWLDSEPGQGTTFHFTVQMMSLPVSKEPALSGINC